MRRVFLIAVLLPILASGQAYFSQSYSYTGITNSFNPTVSNPVLVQSNFTIVVYYKPWTNLNAAGHFVLNFGRQVIGSGYDGGFEFYEGTGANDTNFFFRVGRYPVATLVNTPNYGGVTNTPLNVPLLLIGTHETTPLVTTNRITLYINNVLRSRASGSTVPSFIYYATNTIHNVMGNSSANAGAAGTLYFVRLYNRVLSANEMTVIYNAMPIGSDNIRSGLVLELVDFPNVRTGDYIDGGKFLLDRTGNSANWKSVVAGGNHTTSSGTIIGRRGGITR